MDAVTASNSYVLTLCCVMCVSVVVVADLILRTCCVTIINNEKCYGLIVLFCVHVN